MRRKISYLRYFSILVLTIMIFIVGIYIGTSVEQQRVKALYDDLQDQSLAYQNLVTENNYMNYILSKINFNSSKKNCNLITGSYFTSIKNLDNSRIKLENYINSGNGNEKAYLRLKKYYSDLQVDYWITAKKIREKCPDSNINTILYFYKNKKKCPSCEDEGVHLNYVKQKLKDNVLIFSLDADNNQGVIRLLNQQFQNNYREMPVLVINGKEYGFKTNREIFNILKNQSKQIKDNGNY